MSNPLDNLGAACVGMYAAIKIFRHNGVDPHQMCDAIIREVFNGEGIGNGDNQSVIPGVVTGNKRDDATGGRS